MKVFSFFRAVAEGVAAQGFTGLVEEVPGGKYFVQLAQHVAARYKQTRRDQRYGFTDRSAMKMSPDDRYRPTISDEPSRTHVRPRRNTPAWRSISFL